MAAPTRARPLSFALVALLSSTAFAQDAPTVESAKYVLGEEEQGFSIEAVGFRFSYMLQRGFGFQSKADPDKQGRGDEEMTLVQPTGYIDLRQDEKILHKINFAVDLVTSASADALDAISAASRVNEAGAIDITTLYRQNEHTTWKIRYGGHWEEPLVALWAGLGVDLSMADDNFTLSLSGQGNIDLFDQVTPTGRDDGVTSRSTFNGNIGATQLLSPTTIASVSYGITYQYGTLAQTWNSVAFDESDLRLSERFRQSRLRHAASARLSQHIPQTSSTLHASYRFYADDYKLRAHTADVTLYQYLGKHFCVRGDYRFHTQTSVDFWTSSLPLTFDRLLPRTADSDLSAFDAHEFGGKLVYLFHPKGSAQANDEFFDVSYLHYRRSNGMRINILSLGYGTRF